MYGPHSNVGIRISFFVNNHANTIGNKPKILPNLYGPFVITDSSDNSDADAIIDNYEIHNSLYNNATDDFDNQESHFSNSIKAYKSELRNSFNTRDHKLNESGVDLRDTASNDLESSTDFDEAYSSELSASVSSLSLNPTAYETRRTGNCRKVSLNFKTRKIGPSRAREMKLRRDNDELKNKLEKQEKETSHWQKQFCNLQKRYEDALKNLKSLRKKTTY